MDKVKIGWSEVDITPKKGVKIGLAGQFFERITDQVESPLKIIAMAVESGHEQMILVACDLASVSQNLNEAVKENLKDKLEISVDKVILSAIHTHTSYTYTRNSALMCKLKKMGSNSVQAFDYFKKVLPPDMKYVPLTSDEKSLPPQEALEFLVEKISEAVILAWKNRKPAYYQNAFGRVAVGMCRRVCYDDGSAKMWGDTNLANFEVLEGGNDSGMELIYTYDENKELTGVVANIACPAQVVEHRSFISSDYWGKVRENLKNKFGRDVKVLGLCAPAGDQCPRDMIRWVNPETPIDDPNIKRENYIERRADPSMFDVSGLKVVGRRISNEIISVYEELDGEFKDQGLLIHKTKEVSLPLRTVSISEYEDAKKQIDDYIAKNRGKQMTFEDNAKMHVYSGIMTRYQTQQKVNTIEIEVHFIRFGDVAIATSPFELFLDYGNQIRARSKAKQTILVQLACGADGYLPTKKAEQGGHYSAYVSSGTTGHVGGNMLVRTTLENINEMFNE